MFKTILVATDLSENSDLTLRHALAIARSCQARLHIVHALEDLSDDARNTLMMFVLDDKTRSRVLRGRGDAARALLSARLEEFWQQAGDKDLDSRDLVSSAEVVDGPPAEAILREAQRLEAELIVLGAHRHSVSQTYLGTVAKRVLRRSRVPTLIVPRPE